MKKDVFVPADILIPKGITLGKWSVIACDQFSSEPDYWETLRASLGGEPSTLYLILPEAFLDRIDTEQEIEKISRAMEYYAGQKIFEKIEKSFIYIERTLLDGSVRRGLLGAVDLDEYDYSGGKASILASEGTVLDRLPARIGIRRVARYELPHIMAFIDDIEKTVIEPLSKKCDKLPVLYDFELSGGGGRIKGRCVCGNDADEVAAAMRALHEKKNPLIIIGDGNHSLAAAKVYWDELKKNLSAAERENHPAGKALLEINNVYDPAIKFEAIHRIILDTDPGKFITAMAGTLTGGSDYTLHWFSSGQNGTIGISAGCIGDMLTELQAFLDSYMNSAGCRVDYIHGEDVVRQLSREKSRTGLILPTMDKSELFRTVISKGLFPKKSFSVGHARDKRYYLECREIVYN